MTKKERVLAVLRGETPDRIPAGFWLHFPERAFHGDEAVKAHLDFFEKTGTDIQKIMNEYVVPCDIPIKKAADWKNLKPFTRQSPFITGHVEMIKRILDKTGGEGLTLATIHGIVASAQEADFIIAPVNAGAKLYKAGKSTYKLAAVVSWGNLFIAAQKADLTAEDLNGAKITLFGENTINASVVLYALKANGIHDQRLRGAVCP